MIQVSVYEQFVNIRSVLTNLQNLMSLTVDLFVCLVWSFLIPVLQEWL